MKKRILAFVICVVMLAGALPLTPSAAYALSSVKIDGLSAPVEGFIPDYKVEYDNTVTLTAGNNNANYYKNGICWYDMTTGSLVNVYGKFVAGHQYKATLYIEANAGYSFTSTASVNVDGVDAVEVERDGNNRIVVEIVFDPIPQYTYVDTVEYRTAIHLVAGNELETVALMRMNGTDKFGDILDLWDGAWYVSDTKTGNPADYEKYNGSTYVHSVAFAYRAEIVLEEGYKFANERFITLNITTRILDGVCQSLSDDGRTAVYWFFFDPISAKPMSSVSYTLSGYEFDAPITGITVSSTSSVNTSSYGKDYFITSGNRIPIETGSFEANKYYYLYIAVTSDAYDTSSLTKNDISLNGKTANATEVNNGTLFAIFSLDKLGIPTIEIVSITLATEVVYPEAGKPFFYPTVYAVNGNEDLKDAVILPDIGENFGWYMSNYYIEDDVYYKFVEDTSIFEAGKAYLFFATAYAAEGYTLADGCFIIISTPDGLVPTTPYDMGETYVQYNFYYNLGAPDTLPVLENVKIELGGYTAGKAVNDISVTPILNGKATPYPPVDGMPMYGTYYVIFDGNGMLVEKGNFEYDTDYTLALILNTIEYDTFNLKPNDVTLNGKPADILNQELGITELRFKLPRLANVTALPFTDVKPEHWFAASVAYCVEKGYVSGMTETTFVPNGKLTRAQFLTILAKLDGVDLTKYDTADSGFTDVKTSHWYNEVVCWAVENGITSGLSKTLFGPNNNVTRAQLARFFYVYSEKNGINVDGRADLSAFPDVEKVADWAKTPVEWAVNAGLISGVAKDGKNYLDPNGTATRAQATVMFKAYDAFRGVNN